MTVLYMKLSQADTPSLGSNVLNSQDYGSFVGNILFDQLSDDGTVFLGLKPGGIFRGEKSA